MSNRTVSICLTIYLRQLSQSAGLFGCSIAGLLCSGICFRPKLGAIYKAQRSGESPPGKGFVRHLFLASIKSAAAASMNQFECQLIDGKIIIKGADRWRAAIRYSFLRR